MQNEYSIRQNFAENVNKIHQEQKFAGSAIAQQHNLMIMQTQA